MKHNLIPTSDTETPEVALASKHIPELFDILNETLNNGGIVFIDGQPGAGKSTLAGQIKEEFDEIQAPNQAVILPHDEYMLPRQHCEAIRRRVLNQATSEDLAILDTYGLSDIQPGQPFYGDMNVWWHDIMKLELETIQSFLSESRKGGLSRAFTLTRERARINSGAQQLFVPTILRFTAGDMVLVEGKYACSPYYGSVDGLRVRVDSDPEITREQFRKRRAALMLGNRSLSEDMAFYDLVIRPSWTAYDEQTRGFIDVTVDPNTAKITRSSNTHV